MAGLTGISIIVCPQCQYGYRDAGGPGSEFVCPRSECGHRWEAIGQTIRAVHGVERRRGVSELSVVAGGTPLKAVLATGETTIGRETGCQVVLDNLSVSRRHCRIVATADGASIEDLASSCGTAVNGVFIQGAQRLWPGDQILLGGTTLRFDVRYEAVEARLDIADSTRLIQKGEKSEVAFRGVATDSIPLDSERITFGRNADRDVVLPGPLISARHALLEHSAGGHFLSDVQSASGTYVNGKPIIRTRLESGDRIQIGPYLFRYEGNRLVRTQRPTAIGVEARRLSKRSGATVLLDDLTFALVPGEFIGLIGPSGAGKTTLLDALNGLRPATDGGVYLNGDPLYEEYARLRHHVGYVPQDDIIHRELTCQEALRFAARLRLPADMADDEIQRTVDETLKTLDLAHRSQVPIAHLSGGQRKRMSIGVELLSRPGILFLDEPTSGLDPGTESRLMKLFRRLADQGRTVVCTTHVMENIDLFHKVVILAPGGRLAFFGPPQEAQAFFGIEKFCDLYDRMEELSPTEWQAQYRGSPQFQRYIQPLLHQFRAETPRRFARSDAGQRVSAVGQWWTLTSRLLRLQWADRTTLGVMLAQPIVIALLICLVCRELPLISFLLVISALWFGCSGAAQQIVKERPIYRRERMVNLRLDAYLFSKSVPLMLLTAVQALLMLGITWLLEDSVGSTGWLYLSLLFAAWNGVGIGLLISACASNGDKAMSVVPLTLIPQIILAGVMVPLPDTNAPTRAAASLVAARWANQACEVALLEGREINPELLSTEHLRPLWNLYPSYELKSAEGQAEFLKDYGDGAVRLSYKFWYAICVLGVFVAGLWMLTCYVLKRQDTL